MTDNSPPDRPDETDEPWFVEGAVNRVRDTHQLYVPTAVSRRREWPIEAGDGYRGIVHPSGCVILWPEGDPPDLPLTVAPPDAGDIPWPLSSMGAPPPDWARLDVETTQAVADARTKARTNGGASTTSSPVDRPDAHPGRRHE